MIRDARERRNLVVGLVAISMVVAACGEGSASTSTTAAGVTTTIVTDTTEAAPSTTEAAPPTTTLPATSTSTLPATTLPLPAFPPERTDLEHGGDTWAVVLAADEEFAAPDMEAAVLAAQEAGYSTGPTDCDVGAATALGLAEDSGHFYTVSVYLRSETDALEALQAFQARGVDGKVALIQTFCMD